MSHRPYIAQVLLVGLGGFIGSSLRFMVGGWVHRMPGLGGFPYGTLVVNVTGCLLIGLLGGLADVKQAVSPAQRLLFLIGVLGGYTTFSSFAFETLTLAQDSQPWKALGNVLSQVGFGLIAAWFGYTAARFL